MGSIPGQGTNVWHAMSVAQNLNKKKFWKKHIIPVFTTIELLQMDCHILKLRKVLLSEAKAHLFTNGLRSFSQSRVLSHCPSSVSYFQESLAAVSSWTWLLRKMESLLTL